MEWTAAGGTFMGKPIDDVKKLLDDMQENHAQWHVERTTTKRVNAIEENNAELISKLDELISVMKGKEEVKPYVWLLSFYPTQALVAHVLPA